MPETKRPSIVFEIKERRPHGMAAAAAAAAAEVAATPQVMATAASEIATETTVATSQIYGVTDRVPQHLVFVTTSPTVVDVLGDGVRVVDGLDLVRHVDHHVIAGNFISIISVRLKTKNSRFLM